MKKVSDLKAVFRTINQGLLSLEGMDINQKNKTIQALVTINEALCDETETLLRKFLTLKDETQRELRSVVGADQA